jgi:hypothetical protein
MTAYLPSSVALVQLKCRAPSADVLLPVPSSTLAITTPAAKTPVIVPAICLLFI